MAEILAWEDPPEKLHSRGNRSPWSAVAHEVRSHPNTWAKILETGIKATAWSLAWNINNGRNKAFRKGFRAEYRPLSETTSAVYVIYQGEETGERATTGSSDQ